jgi:hypothetical protein
MTRKVTKAVLTCTDKGYRWDIYCGEAIAATKEMRLTDTGAKATVKGDPLECVEMDLHDAIETNDPYEVARALELGQIVADPIKESAR